MKKITYDGQDISIDHLAPMTIECPCEDIGRNLKIGVDFKNHCYSKEFIDGTNTKEEIILYDTPDKPRVFCPIRHGLSLRLPGIMNDLPNRRVNQTPERRNYVYALPLKVEEKIYEIFFMIQRAESDPVLDLRLTVESAYVPDKPTQLPKRPSAIRFKLLAYKTLRREPIEFAAR